jgi:hypothetical protein
MSNPFEYRPELKYTPKEINTIDNVSSNITKQAEPYIINNTPSITKRIDSAKEALSEVISSLQSKSSKVESKISITLDESMISTLSELSDGAKLINDGILTYQLYQEAKTNPTLSILCDAWNEYQTGINGSIEAELLPLAEEVDLLLNNIQYLVDNTLLYYKDPSVLTDEVKLKESELAEVIRYAELQEQLKAAINSASSDTVSINKQLDVAELKLDYKKNIVLTLRTSLSKVSAAIENLSDATVEEFQEIQQRAITKELGEVASCTSLTKTGLKTVTYSAFAKQYQDVLGLVRSHNNSIDSNVISNITKTAVVDARLYRDVAIDAITELSYADSELQVNNIGDTLISGIESMVKSYENSIFYVKNAIESDIIIVEGLINSIYEKYKTRMIYKSISD